MSRDDDAREHFVGDLIGDEIADIAAAKDGLIESALILGGQRVTGVGAHATGVVVVIWRGDVAMPRGRCANEGARLRTLVRTGVTSGRSLARRFESGLEIGLIRDFLDVFDMDDFVVLIDHEDHASV